MPELMRIEEECFGSEKFAPEVVRAFLLRDDTFIVVAVDDDSIAGSAMCLISKAESEGKVASIAVLRECRRHGVGSKLLAECEKVFEAQNLARYTLEVEDVNLPATALYVSKGYAIKWLIRDFYGLGRHAYAMEKTVARSHKKLNVRSA